MVRCHQCLSAFWVSRTGFLIIPNHIAAIWSVTNACRRFGSVGPVKDDSGELFVELSVTNACRRFGSVGRAKPTIESIIQDTKSPMPVGVLGQSDPHKSGAINKLTQVTNACRRFGSVGHDEGPFVELSVNGGGHQCLSAFWVSRTAALWSKVYLSLFEVTNACRRFGSVGQRFTLERSILYQTWRHQCLSAFWVSRTSSRFGKGDC